MNTVHASVSSYVWSLEKDISANSVTITIWTCEKVTWRHRMRNLSFSILHVSQGSVTTNLRHGGNFYTSFFWKFYRLSSRERIPKSVRIWQSYCENSTTLFETHCTEVWYKRYLPACLNVAIRQNTWPLCCKKAPSTVNVGRSQLYRLITDTVCQYWLTTTHSIFLSEV